MKPKIELKQKDWLILRNEGEKILCLGIHSWNEARLCIFLIAFLELFRSNTLYSSERNNKENILALSQDMI